jgi:multiple sugar transport system substrate-binding protein
MNFGAKFFTGTGKDAQVTVGDAELALPERIRQMADDGSLDPTSITQSGGDVMPAFLKGKYAMTVQGSYAAQTLVESAPKNFHWAVLPPLEGTAGATQAANPQTLSVAAESPHVKEAAEFIDYYMQAENLAKVAEGDWLIPTSSTAADAVRQDTGGQNGWDQVLASGSALTQAPFQSVTNYPQWKDQIATPAFQKYLAGDIDKTQLAKELTDGWGQVGG